MGFFDRKKKENTCCACTARAGTTPARTGNEAGVKVLGSGCAKCNALEAAARQALADLGMDTTIDHVTDFAQIAAYGVMTTPALVVDGKVVAYGRVLTKEEAAALIRKARGV